LRQEKAERATLYFENSNIFFPKSATSNSGMTVCYEMTGTEKKNHCYTYILRSCSVVFIGKKNELNKRNMKKWFEGWLSWTVLHPRITFIKQQIFFFIFLFERVKTVAVGYEI
jgi:hypothetical protein